MNHKNLIPNKERLLAKVINETEIKTASGLYLSNGDDMPYISLKVIALPEKRNVREWQKIPQVGDTIYITRHTGTYLDPQYAIVKFDEILCWEEND